MPNWRDRAKPVQQGWRSRAKKIQTPSVEEEILNFQDPLTEGMVKKSAARRAGVKSLIPYSDQLASQLTGKSVEDTYNERVQLMQDESIAAGLGMGAGAVATGLATGGLGTVGQAALGTTQAMGITAGNVQAQGGTVPEAIEQAGYSGLISAGIQGLPEVLKGGKKLINKVRENFTGITADEALDRAAAGTLGANKSQTKSIVVDKPGLGKTLLDEDLVPSAVTPKSKIVKLTKAKVDTVGKQVTAQVEQAGVINSHSVAQRLLDKVDELSVNSANASKVAKLRNLAKKILSEEEKLMPGDAFAKKKLFDKKAFNNKHIYDKTQTTTDNAEVSRIAREAYKQEIVDSLQRVRGNEAVETFNHLNNKFSNLKAIENIVTNSQFDKGFLSTLADRTTIGAVMVAGRNPALAAGFFGGREVGKALSPKLKFQRPQQASFGQALTSPATVPATAAFTNPFEK